MARTADRRQNLRNEREAHAALQATPPPYRTYAEGVREATANLRRQFAATTTVVASIGFVLGMVVGYSARSFFG